MKTLMRHLDSNTVAAYLNDHPEVHRRVREHLPDLGISAVVLAELLYGALNSTRVERNVARLRDFVRLVTVVPFCPRCVEVYAPARVALRKKGRPAPALDLLIAATALAHDVALVTENTRDFQHVPGLRLENWIR